MFKISLGQGPASGSLLGLFLLVGAVVSNSAGAQAQAQDKPTATIAAATSDSDPLKALQWRLIGPFRGGRTVAATGVPGIPNLFYVAANNGGVWKTTDYG